VLVKNIYPMMLGQFSSLTTRYLQWSHWKPQKLTKYATAATKKKDVRTKRSRTQSTFRYQSASGPQNTSLILVDHGVNVIGGCYRKVMLL